MAKQNEFSDSVTRFEHALARALNSVTQTGSIEHIERVTELLIQKEMILHSLFRKINDC